MMLTGPTLELELRNEASEQPGLSQAGSRNEGTKSHTKESGRAERGPDGYPSRRKHRYWQVRKEVCGRQYGTLTL